MLSHVRHCAVALALALPGLAAGACATPPAGGPRAVADGQASLQLRQQLRPAAGPRRLQAVVDPWTAADVVQLEVTLSELGSGNPVPRAHAERAYADAALPLVFHGLKAGTTYRVLARAYRAGGKHEAYQISDDAASTLEIEVQSDDLRTEGVLPVQLKARHFDGSASADAISFVPGGYTPGLRGLVTTLAGGPAPGDADGLGDATRLREPAGVLWDGTGGAFFLDRQGHRLRRMMGNRQVTTVAGNGIQGDLDNASGPNARFRFPEGLVRGSGGTLYVADTGNHTIRRIEPSSGFAVTTIAGAPTILGLLGGLLGSNARFDSPTGLAVVGSTLYVADTGNNRVRQVALSGMYPVDPVAGGGANTGNVALGTNASLIGPSGLAYDGDGWLYVSDSGHRQIKRIRVDDPAFPVEVIAGSGLSGSVDADGTAARFVSPRGLTISGSTLYIADVGAHRIRAIELDDPAYPVRTVAGDSQAFGDGLETARFNAPGWLTVSTEGHLIVADGGNHRLRAVR